ncbi:MAG: hypothetical protein U0Q22_04025 [Acidimicrobiales bacterium]
MDDISDFVLAFTVMQATLDHYCLLVGRLMSETAAIGTNCDGVIALDRGLPSGAYADLPIEIVSMHFREKVERVGDIAARQHGELHPATQHLRTTALRVADLRNLVAHGHIETGSPRDGTVTVVHSPRKSGYTETEINLQELEQAIDDSKTVAAHAVFVWSNLPGSPGSGLTLEELE